MVWVMGTESETRRRSRKAAKAQTGARAASSMAAELQVGVGRAQRAVYNRDGGGTRRSSWQGERPSEWDDESHWRQWRCLEKRRLVLGAQL